MKLKSTLDFLITSVHVRNVEGFSGYCKCHKEKDSDHDRLSMTVDVGNRIIEAPRKEMFASGLLNQMKSRYLKSYLRYILKMIGHVIRGKYNK